MKTLTLTDEQARALRGILIREYDSIIEAMGEAEDRNSKEEYEAGRARLQPVIGMVNKFGIEL